MFDFCQIVYEYLLEIVWTVVDIAGNETDCSFDVLVNAYVGFADLCVSGVSIYPNPTNGIINFDFADILTSLNACNIQKIKITDITGKIISLSKLSASNNQLQADLSGFENGIYIISIQTDKEMFTLKIVKE